MTQQPLKTIEETAKLLNVDPTTVRRWIKQGRIRAHNFGQDYRIKQEAIDTFLAETEVKVEK